MTPLIRRLPEGPLDIIGDIHGELNALLRLLERLGCDPVRLTASRPLVFVGDLIDRGPDSPAIVDVVRRLCGAGLAQCVLGNHELNAILRAKKQGNGWLFGHSDRWAQRTEHGALMHDFSSATATPQQAKEMLAWFSTLPIALVRADLRVVHACWSNKSLTLLPETGDLASLYQSYEAAIDDTHRRSGLLQRARAEVSAIGGIERPDPPVVAVLPAAAELAQSQQNDNPLRVLTSGRERSLVGVGPPFYVGGKWRMVRRDDWWHRYTEAPSVIVGHYWRRRDSPVSDKPDTFQGRSPLHWVGGGGGVFCVDFSVGRRFQERVIGDAPPFVGTLAAMRWPEQVLVFDDDDAHYATQR